MKIDLTKETEKTLEWEDVDGGEFFVTIDLDLIECLNYKINDEQYVIMASGHDTNNRWGSTIVRNSGDLHSDEETIIRKFKVDQWVY